MTTLQETSDCHVPYVRRRNTPAQLTALQQLFEAVPHPTRAQRQAIANDIGMELKSVTNWFQNRRQTSRKKSLSSSENDPPRTRLSPRHRRSNTPLDRSKISLDRIATLSERPSLTLQLNSQRIPFTPRKSNVQHKDPSSPLELWTHMLSSPVVPPSAPDPEEVRLAALSSRAKTLCPLEWACLKARQKKWDDEDTDRLPTHLEVDEDETEPKTIDLESSDASGLNRGNSLFSRPNKMPQFEDVEAALTLLGFKTRS
ncbi:hypothetical protein L210DRAFT_840966 [Boletus edulis BED1]|uniref:Homeobox domain-containing protein n=1 Tax=Boletus edulis BED1 TaxID=1328754 RepID=A0AAD4C136_BOLED|nr:hypothetical protein L210DRAFT_840966 [Boletus edulis BED1]